MNAQELTTLQTCYVCGVLVTGEYKALVVESPKDYGFSVSVCSEHEAEPEYE